MPLHADTRHETHQARHARWVAAAEKHRAAERRALDKGKAAAADLARKAAEKAERHARENRRAADRIERHVPRARTARRQNEASSAAILAKAIMLAAETPRPVEVAPKEAKRQAKEAEKLARRHEQAAATERQRRRRAGIEHDERTAAAQRDITIGSRKGADGRGAEAVASLSDLGSLIARRQDRTIPRIRAADRFDLLCHRADAGLFPEPRFERGVDRSAGIPGVPDDRADSLREMQKLTAYIGVDAEQILRARVYERRSFSWMAEAGMGDAELLGRLFLRALDRTAVFYGISQSPDSREAHAPV